MDSAKIKVLQLIVILSFALCVLLTPNQLFAQNELINLDLDQLTKIKVTSVAKTDQNALDAPAAVTVLTASDIRHAGVTNLPDALRLVPGMQVSQFGSNQWAINARGPQSIFANKLLVAGGGSEERSLLRARQGGRLGENSTYRVWGTRSRIDSINIENAGEAHDGWENSSIVFRPDAATFPVIPYTVGNKSLSASVGRHEVPRSVFAKMEVRFWV